MDGYYAAGLIMGGTFFTLMMLVSIAIGVVTIIGQWKLFEKAGAVSYTHLQ